MTDSKTHTEMKRAKAILKKKLKHLHYQTPRPPRVCECSPHTAQAARGTKQSPETGPHSDGTLFTTKITPQ